MAFKTVFKRYELKFLINAEQKQLILNAMAPFMELDSYGRSTIRNIYFDTDDFLLIRRSIDKPVYKEKMRMRSYGRASDSSTVFVELKRKYNHVVYKRRISLPYKAATEWTHGSACSKHTQISREIDYFFKLYKGLSPKVFLSYEREAYYSKDKSDFRITFDENVIFRLNDLSLASKLYGTPILEAGQSIMEIKCSGGIPLWLTRVLSEQKIYKTSFSKYGTVYSNFIFKKEKVNV